MNNTVEWRRERYLKHRESEIASAVQWQRAHRHRLFLYWKASSANKRYPGKLKAIDIEEILRKCGRACYHCKKANLDGRDLTLEHLQPVNDPQFIVIACLSCNTARIPTLGPRKTAEQRRIAANTRHASWRRANPEHILEYAREYREKNAAALKEYRRQYRLKRKAEAAARGEKYKG